MTGYIDSYYTRTLNEDAVRLVLAETIEAEICIIGGGLAGLATAISLAERGRKPVLLEGNRIGWGASGRNGGFVLSGYSLYARALAKKVGLSRARQLYDLARQAQLLVRKRIDDYNIACDPVHGHLVASWYDTPEDLREEAAFLRDNFGENVEFWPRERVREVCHTDKYYDGKFFPDCFHMHTLNYVRGIARAIEDKGGRIFEHSGALRLEEKPDAKIVHTEKGSVKADHVVFCGSAYFNGLEKVLARSCLAIRSNVMVTEPIPAETLQSAITEPYAIRDNRWADDYYRVLPDNRILWGGGCALAPPPAGLKERMLQGLLKIYPQLEGIKADVAWSGLMGFMVNKMPCFSRLRPGVWACTNVGGQGLNVTSVGGEVIARAIAENDETYRLFEPFGQAWAGGILGPYVAQGIYYCWQARDRLYEFKKERQKAA